LKSSGQLGLGQRVLSIQTIFWEKGRMGYVLERQIGFLLRKAHQYATEIFADEVGARGVTPQQFSIILRLSERGEQSHAQLGQANAMDPATTLGVVNRLAERGLVAVRKDPDDRRRRLVQLTVKGQEEAAALRRHGPVITARTLAGLTPQEQETLVALLEKLAAGTEESAQSSAAGPTALSPAPGATDSPAPAP